MMNNPAAAMRMLMTYAVCIPLAIFVGYLLTNPLDYGSLGFLGFVLMVMFSPPLIKFHYEIMLFALGSPIVLFFIVMRPPMGQAMVLVSLTIAIVERTLSRRRRFVNVPSMTWPMFFILAVVILTMELTGGMGFHSFGSSGGGGRKYIVLFVSILTYFAITSRPFPPENRNFYIALYFLAGLPSFIGDIGPYLPSPLNYVNLLIPPSLDASAIHVLGDVQTTISRFGAVSTTMGVLTSFMLVKWGLRGIFMGNRLWRTVAFIACALLSLVGGYRSTAVGLLLIIGVMFFMEGLHRTRLLGVFLFGFIFMGALLVPLSNKLPMNVQRSLTFLPLNWSAEAIIQAEGSSEWRLRIWRDLWPKVPQYLLLGKGYAMSAEDYQSIGEGVFAGGYAAAMDASQEALAISADYHNGPLSALIPFGIWGAIGFLWMMFAGLRVLYRNHKYSEPELRTVNAFFMGTYIVQILTFFFIFGAFQDDVGKFARVIGISIALNGGLLGPKVNPVVIPRIKPQRIPVTA